MEDENLLNESIIDNNVDASEVSATSVESDVANQSAEDNVNADNVESSEMNGNEKVVTAKTNPSQFTREEQMTYSFRKQLSKQKAKHEKEIADLRAEFNKKLAEEIDKATHPEKYRPKTRADFEYDDDYVKYLAKDEVNQVLKEQMEQYQKQQEEEARQVAMEDEYREVVDQSMKSIYTTPEAQADWKAKVGEAMQKGLGKMIDADTDMSNYIIFSPIGPKIMYELATNKKAVQDLFTIGKTPDGRVIPRSAQDRMRKLEQLAERLETDINNNKSAVQQPKPVGRPGLNKEVKKDIFSDPKALLDMMS